MDDKNRNRIAVYLSFSGYDGNPDSISSLVGLVPLSVHKIGERWPGRSVPVSRSFWSAKLIEGDGDDVGKLVDDAVLGIMAKSSEIASISGITRNESYVGVTVRMGGNMPFINISIDTMRFMAEMKLNLDIGFFA